MDFRGKYAWNIREVGWHRMREVGLFVRGWESMA